MFFADRIRSISPSDRVPEAVAGLTTVIFSKDRAMQLDALLASLYLHSQDSELLHPKVLFTCSSEQHEAQYRELASAYPQVEFVAETDFAAQMVAILHSTDKILFLVDDALFVRGFSARFLEESLDTHTEVVGISLRLGKNTGYCYPSQSSQTVPQMESLGNNYFFYDWSAAEGDFGYPFEVSSSCYRTKDVIKALAGCSFKNPNELEGALAACARKALLPAKKLLICPGQSIAFSCPVNIVQTCCPNLYEASQG